jgi:CTP synthase (UTP-ammonia lyase)
VDEPGARIAVLGDRNVEFVTHREMDAAIALLPGWAAAEWVGTDSAAARSLDGVDGLWVVSGGPYRDDEAVYAAIRHARESGLPLLATCSGFQYTVIEFARNVAGLDAAHAETEPDADTLVVDRLACSLVGETREVTCVPGTRLAAICGTGPFTGFHWCNFGLAQRFVDDLTAAGLVVAAHADDAGVEGVELPSHPFFIGTLFQPQVGSLDGRPLHPLILAFLDAARPAGVPAIG